MDIPPIPMNKPVAGIPQIKVIDSESVIALEEAFAQGMPSLLDMEEKLTESKRTYDHWLRSIGESVMKTETYHPHDRSHAIELAETIRQQEMAIQTIRKNMYERAIRLLEEILPQDTKDKLSRMPDQKMAALIFMLLIQVKAKMSTGRKKFHLLDEIELDEEEIDTPDEHMDTSSVMKGIPRSLPPEIDPANPYNQL